MPGMFTGAAKKTRGKPRVSCSGSQVKNKTLLVPVPRWTARTETDNGHWARQRGATEGLRQSSFTGVRDRTTVWSQWFDRRTRGQKSDSKIDEPTDFCCKEKEK